MQPKHAVLVMLARTYASNFPLFGKISSLNIFFKNLFKISVERTTQDTSLALHQMLWSSLVFWETHIIGDHSWVSRVSLKALCYFSPMWLFIKMLWNTKWRIPYGQKGRTSADGDVGGGDFFLLGVEIRKSAGVRRSARTFKRWDGDMPLPVVCEQEP